MPQSRSAASTWSRPYGSPARCRRRCSVWTSSSRACARGFAPASALSLPARRGLPAPAALPAAASRSPSSFALREPACSRRSCRRKQPRPARPRALLSQGDGHFPSNWVAGVHWQVAMTRPATAPIRVLRARLVAWPPLAGPGVCPRVPDRKLALRVALRGLGVRFCVMRRAHFLDFLS
jgi:hypothetical protein